MTIPAALAAAIAVFRELGWDAARPDEVMRLPLGTPEQQRIAKAGLVKGAWGSFGETAPNTYGWISWIDVDEDLLGAFAVRVGVPVRRAIAVLPTAPRYPSALRGALIASRGPAFTKSFAEGYRRGWGTEALIYAVAYSGADLPESIGYLESWANAATETLDDSGAFGGSDAVPEDVIAVRFTEHLRAALRSGNPPSYGAPGARALLLGGIARGWIDVDEARDLVLFAMEQAQRPSDRVAWASVLVDALGAERDWLLERSGVLISAMSLGDNAIISRFAPMLLESGDDELVGQAMLVGLLAKSTKAKTELLERAAALSPPGARTRTLVAESVASLLTAKDRRLRARAEALVAAWQLDAQVVGEEAPEPVRGLWRPTPPLAPVPRFDAGEVSVGRLSELASILVVAKAEALTLDGERFLTIANALARKDPKAARTALRGVKNHSHTGLIGAADWVKGSTSRYLDSPATSRWSTTRMIGPARNASVFQRLGSVPMLLSTPSWDDYRIDPADLAARLDAYAEAGVEALEADLQLALPRLDLDLLTEAVTKRLTTSTLPILLQDGTTVPRPVGEVMRDWLREPLVHPGFEDEQATYPRALEPVPAIEGLPARLTSEYLWSPLQVFPTWPEARIERGAESAATLRTRANGVVPSTQLLDSVGLDALPLDAAIAAWKNGVLLPEVADARRLGWQGQISSLAARATAWAELAEEGMLSVVWPLAVQTIAYATRGAKITPGVDALVELLTRFLPEAQAAIDQGIVDAEVLALPSVRALAERGGSSRAVAAARALVALLPVAAAAPAPVVTRMSDEEFALAWPEVADPPVISDGARIAIVERAGRRGTYLEPTVFLQDGSAHFITSLDWAYPLTQEQQVPAAGGARATTWLRYSHTAGALLAGVGREDPGRSAEDRQLSQTLVTVLCLTQFVQPDTPSFDFYGAIEAGDLGTARITAAVETLLGFDGIDPYPLVRRLGRHPEALPAIFPALTRSLRHAATLPGKPPRWVVRVIDVATEFAPALREAAGRGLLPAEDAAWPGLADLATASLSPTVKKKAAALLAALGLR